MLCGTRRCRGVLGAGQEDRVLIPRYASDGAIRATQVSNTINKWPLASLGLLSPVPYLRRFFALIFTPGPYGSMRRISTPGGDRRISLKPCIQALVSASDPTP